VHLDAFDVFIIPYLPATDNEEK